MGLFDVFSRAKREAPAVSPESPTPSDFDKVLITLKINDATALFVLLAEDGTVNRMGTGGINNAENDMFIGRCAAPLFTQYMAAVSPELLRRKGGYRMPDPRGATCELTLVFGYRRSDKCTRFKFHYGSESQGPPDEICKLLLLAVELTTDWHEEQKRIAEANQPPPR